MSQRFDRVIQNGLVFSDGVLTRTDLAIKDGRVAALGTGFDAEETIHAEGLWVLPGLVDPHVHPIHAETYESVSQAALHGGVTTLFHMLYTPPDGDPEPFTQASAKEAATQSLVDFSFHVRLNELRRTQPAIPAIASGGNPSFKLFLAYGSRGVMIGDDEAMLAMQAAERSGATLLFHAENGPLTDLYERQARERGVQSVGEYYESRPKWMETEAVHRTLMSARASGCRTYYVHLTCPESVAEVTRAKAQGVAAFAETCPHYLLLTASDGAEIGPRAKMAPPLRGKSDQDALWDALAKGLIDTIGSDHSAFVREEKEAFDTVLDAGFGVPGIATMFPLLYSRGVADGRIGLKTLVDAMSTTPAQIFGLAGRKGALSVGHDADLMLFDPEAPFEITDESEKGNAYYSIYKGMKGVGSIRSVYTRGLPRIVDGELVNASTRGQYLTRTSHTLPGGAHAAR